MDKAILIALWSAISVGLHHALNPVGDIDIHGPNIGQGAAAMSRLMVREQVDRVAPLPQVAMDLVRQLVKAGRR